MWARRGRGRQEAESSWALPCYPLSQRGEPSGGVLVSSAAAPLPAFPTWALWGAAFLSAAHAPNPVEGPAQFSRRLTCPGWV